MQHNRGTSADEESRCREETGYSGLWDGKDIWVPAAANNHLPAVKVAQKPSSNHESSASASFFFAVSSVALSNSLVITHLSILRLV